MPTANPALPRRRPRDVTAPSRPARVLVPYASFGAGHEMAAKALVGALSARGARARAADALRSARGLGGVLRRAFLLLMTRLPLVYGFFFELCDRLFAWAPAARARHAVNRWLYRDFVRAVLEARPDVVVATHYLQLEALARARREGALRATLAVVITDWTPHTFWLDAPADRYYVAGGADGPMVRALVERGVPGERIVASGIPIDLGIARLRPPRRAARAKPSARVIMGGYGVGALERVVRSFGRVRGVRLMSRRVVTTSGAATAAAAVRLMRAERVSTLVIDRRGPEDAWGIVSRADVIRRVVTPGRDPHAVRVHEIMTKPVVTVSPGLAVKFCLRLMDQARVRRAVVFDGHALVGVLSHADVFAALEA